jgi:uncharacterized iron-regulated protein
MRPALRIPSIVLALVLLGPWSLGSAERSALQVGQIIETKSGRVLTFEDWLAAVAASTVIYLGEEHRNRSHIEAAVRILDALQARNRRPILALEMFSWDGQSALDRYLSDRAMPTEQFLAESHWEQNWGGAYADYEPLVSFARDHQFPVLALNPPRPLVRRVALEGWARAMSSPEIAGWRMQDQVTIDDPAYREVIFKQLRACHQGPSDDAYQRMFEASVFRDEGMARTIAEFLDRMPPGHGPVVSYTGGGHIQYRLPIPNRVLRRQPAIRQTTVYFTALDPDRLDEIQTLIQEAIADYIWVTPLGAHGPPRRCR